MWQRPGNIFGRQENRRPDDATRQQQHGIQKRQATNQSWAVNHFSRLVGRNRRQAHSWLSHPEFVRRFQRSSAATANDGGAVAASERIGHFLGAPRTVKWLRVRLRLRVLAP